MIHVRVSGVAADFEQFTRAVQEQDQPGLIQAPVPVIRNVTVLGGGTDGRLFAALSLAQDMQVTLFTAYGTEMNELRAAGGITLRGDGPVGTYQIDQQGSPSIHTTAELDAAVAAADLIFLTGPVHKQRTYAMVLADHLVDGQQLVIAPARTFAAIETDWLLHVGGCRADVSIVELQNMPYWTDANSGPLNLSECSFTLAASVPNDRQEVIHALRTILPDIESAPSPMHSGFSDASGAIECVALMLGGSLVFRTQDSLPEGAVPLEERQTLFSLVDNHRCRVAISELLRERREVARSFGVRNLPDDDEWIERYAGLVAGSGSRRIPSADESVNIIRCAVTGSLVPLQSAGQLAGIATPVTDSLVTLASSTLGRDLATAGRRLEAMGVQVSSIAEVRRRIEDISRGNR